MRLYSYHPMKLPNEEERAPAPIKDVEKVVNIVATANPKRVQLDGIEREVRNEKQRVDDLTRGIKDTKERIKSFKHDAHVLKKDIAHITPKSITDELTRLASLRCVEGIRPEYYGFIVELAPLFVTLQSGVRMCIGTLDVYVRVANCRMEIWNTCIERVNPESSRVFAHYAVPQGSTPCLGDYSESITDALKRCAYTEAIQLLWIALQSPLDGSAYIRGEQFKEHRTIILTKVLEGTLLRLQKGKMVTVGYIKEDVYGEHSESPTIKNTTGTIVRITGRRADGDTIIVDTADTPTARVELRKELAKLDATLKDIPDNKLLFGYRTTVSESRWIHKPIDWYALDALPDTTTRAELLAKIRETYQPIIYNEPEHGT